MENRKTWKTQIWIWGEHEYSETIYGSTLPEIKNNVAQWIMNNQPDIFANSPSNSEISRQYSYTKATEDFPLKPGGGAFWDEQSEITYTSGWIGISGQEKSWSAYKHFDSINEVIIHFMNNSLKIQKGPDWKKIDLIENKIPLHLINTITKLTNEDIVNDHLQSGWYLLVIDKTEDHSWNSIKYILGHPEENANLFELKNEEE